MRRQVFRGVMLVAMATALAAALARPMEYVQLAALALEDAVPQAAQPGRPAGATFAAR